MKKLKTEWNLGLLYTGDTDPQIEKDIKQIEKICADFEKKYKGKEFTKNTVILLRSLEDFEKLTDSIYTKNPHRYFHYKMDLNSENSVASAKASQLEQRLTKAGNKILFFKLAIGKIAAEKHKKILNDKKLSRFTYFLKNIFDRASHTLSEKEEQLDGLLSQTSYTMWVNGQEKLLNTLQVDFKDKKIPVTEATGILFDQNQKDRTYLWKKVHESYKSISHFAEAEINAIGNYKKITDELRGYKKSYSDTVQSYENDERSIETLVSLVTKQYKISHRFYKLQAKMLGKNIIGMEDRGVKAGKIQKKFDFNTSCDIVRTAFNRVDKKYADIFDSYLVNGQIDVYPKKGKRGGAYCSGEGGTSPTFVFLNHTDDVRSVETLGHEMGHAVHTEMSKYQTPLYQLYPISTAEVASTFFEQVTLQEIEKTLSDNEKILFLHTRLMGDVSTIFRQIACFNFEFELHESIRKNGMIPKEEIAKLLAKHLKAYLGDAVKVDTDDGYGFVGWPHIRYFFYVYTYAYGQLISRAMFQQWKKDPSFSKKVEQFLSAGKSMSPEDIFKSIGIDTSKPEFFEAGLKSIEEDIKKLETLVAKQGK
jgi:oligoendopeptidase F